MWTVVKQARSDLFLELFSWFGFEKRRISDTMWSSGYFPLDSPICKNETQQLHDINYTVFLSITAWVGSLFGRPTNPFAPVSPSRSPTICTTQQWPRFWKGQALAPLERQWHSTKKYRARGGIRLANYGKHRTLNLVTSTSCLMQKR